jgi:7,8-didemethyl-8-hydroxy-5-deazariboflavin synthase CofH subunit
MNLANDLLTTDLSSALSNASESTRRLLEGCLEGQELSWEQGCTLSRVTGNDWLAMCKAADAMRKELAGDVVTYVVNRNINFTNVCVKSCSFCAFSRKHRSEEAYMISLEEIIRRTQEAHEFGATEVCIQAGLAPGMEGRWYIDLCQAVKKAVPDIHVHGFSPEEVKYGVHRSGMSIRNYLQALQDVGLGSLPGTSAEIFDDSLRNTISPGRITTDEWFAIIGTAHELGIPTTSTIMFGHIETVEQRVRHLEQLRTLQKQTGGFTEFVPLSFVFQEAPMFREHMVEGLREGLTEQETLGFYALSRLFLGKHFTNLQASWVKEGLAMSEMLLHVGVNDLGGTLMNESISTSAGANYGQLMTPHTLRSTIRNAGRIPAQRDTLYRTLRQYAAQEQADESADPLDSLENADQKFGSYQALTKDQRFRYQKAKGATAKPRTSLPVVSKPGSVL